MGCVFVRACARVCVVGATRGFKLRILIGAPSVAIQLDYANLLATAVVALAQK